MKWKDINGYEGEYHISNCGKVKSLKFSKERILKPNKDKVGYYNVNLSKEGKKKIFKIHLLVWDHFGSGKRNGMKLQVDHIKEKDKSNNHIDNLQLLNPRYNIIKSKDKTKTSSKYLGVSWSKRDNKWLSSIYINGKYKYLGYFDNEYDAHLAYKKELETYVEKL